ncbi:MAG: hypothetical protein D6690_02400 [Nitrospirae bacterium]|nr:MAG: hypothetical protein D6690_02400 [Nitrospirota bacterium]
MFISRQLRAQPSSPASLHITLSLARTFAKVNQILGVPHDRIGLIRLVLVMLVSLAVVFGVKV